MASSVLKLTIYVFLFALVSPRAWADFDVSHIEAIKHQLGRSYLYLNVGGKVLFDGPLNGSDLRGDSLFPIASVSKHMTVFALHHSVQNRPPIEPTTTLEEVFPETFSGKKATLLDLERHRSGVNDDLLRRIETARGLKTAFSPQTAKCQTAEELSLVLQVMPSNSVGPGKNKRSYSNIGMCLLANVIEKKEGEEFHKVMGRLFRKYGMTQTFSAITPLATPLLGWTASRRLEAANPWDFRGSASVVTTPNDLAKWKLAIQALTAEEDPRELKTRLTQDIEIEGNTSSNAPSTIYRMGLFVKLINDRLVFFHGGSMPAHGSYIIYVPDLDLFAFALANDIQNMHFSAIADEWFEQLLK